MRNFLIFLIALLLIGSAAALPMLGPTQGFRNPGDVEIGGTLSVGGVDINGGVVSYDAMRLDIVENETAINSSIAAQAVSQVANETAINSSIAAQAVSQVANETAINNSIANSGVADAAINATAANVAFGQTAQNISIANLGFGNTAQNSTLANLAFAQTAQNSSINNKGFANTAQNNTLANLAFAQTAQNASIANLGFANTAQNSTISGLVVPLVNFAYDANSVDQGIFTASGAWTLTAVKMTPRVAGTDGSAVTVMVKICDSGEAPSAGDNMLSGTLDLKGTADTPQSGTVSSGSIANGKIVALDFTGALTSAVGQVTLYGTRA